MNNFFYYFLLIFILFIFSNCSYCFLSNVSCSLYDGRKKATIKVKQFTAKIIEEGIGRLSSAITGAVALAQLSTNEVIPAAVVLL